VSGIEHRGRRMNILCPVGLVNDFLELVETAATRYAAIAEPESLAKMLARQRTAPHVGI
jgi:hypothetical protein